MSTGSYNFRTKMCRRLLTCIMLFLVCGIGVCAKPLSEKDRLKLADIARNNYAVTAMDGASVYRFKGEDILLVTVEVKKSPNAQRIGQVKASRLAGEFLQTAQNKSVTVYEVSDLNSYSLEDKGEVSGRVSQQTSDQSTMSTEENFSDKIIQSSITRVGHIEPLCRVGVQGNNIVFSYFLIIE